MFETLNKKVSYSMLIAVVPPKYNPQVLGDQ